MVLEECPFCHKFFAAEKVSKEEVDSTEEGMLPEPPTIVPRTIALAAPSVTSGGVGYGSGPPPVEFLLTYKTTYRCKFCGKEWTKTSTEEKEIARSDAGAEQASSEEVAQEAERYEEEQHAEE